MRARRPRLFAALGLLLAAGSRPAAAETPCGALAPSRQEAVRRGAEYLKIFFEGEESREALGTDAVSIFLELGETAVDHALARMAMKEAGRLAAPLVARYSSPGGLEARESLMGALALLPDSGPLHLPRKSSLRLFSSVLARVSGRDPGEAYYGARIDPGRLEALDGDALFGLLIDAYTVERARLAFPDLPAPAPGLGDVLRFAISKPRAALDPDDDDDFYLATHVAYVLSDYSRFRLDPGLLGPIPAYLRAQVPAVLASRDTEAAAEIVDVLRQAGETDADADVCGLTRLLLETQQPDGSWPRTEPGDAYDAVHPAWVAVHALRERSFLPDVAWAERTRALLAAPTRAPPSR